MAPPRCPLSIIHYSLPPLATVAVKVLAASGEDETAIDEVVQAISGEPELMARVLQLVENPAADTGFAAVRSAVVAISIFQLLGAMPDKSGCFSREEFWKHSLAVGCCGELLAEQLSRLDAGGAAVAAADAFVCGLLHDMGKIALVALWPKSYARVVETTDLLRGDIADLERSIIGVDHLVLGKRLAEQWNLPPAIRECAWLHGLFPGALPAMAQNKALVNLISLADVLVRRQQVGYSGNYLFPVSREELAAVVGLNEEAVDAAVAGLAERIEKRRAAFALDDTKANAPRGQTQSGVNALDANTPLAVMQAMAPTAQEMFAGCVAIFSLLPAQSLAEVLLACGSDAPQTLLLACSQRPALASGGNGPVRAVGDDLDWLMSAIRPRLDGEFNYWLALETAGQCIGGIVWGGGAGETARLAKQVPDLAEVSRWWTLALQTSQVRQEAKILAEQLAQANRQLQTAQTQAMQGQMFNALGEFAAGAAHEMNNPLAVISGRSQLLAGQLADPRQRTMAQQIFEQSQRLSDIISDLMDYAKPQPAQRRLCPVGEIIAEARRLAKSKADPADRNIVLELGQAPDVMVDPAQVSAAVAEVLANACQATDPAGGQVKIQSAFDPQARCVVLTITDNGGGMDPHVLPHAFDPFFSSRPAGRRRGMGLPKAQRWIEASGGSIRLESRPSQGTRCVIILNRN